MRNWIQTTLLICFGALVTTASSAEPLAPKSLLIFYGWPSSINGTFSPPLAAAELGAYDYLVLGDGISAASHPDHANTVTILADANLANTTVFGYIDLGVLTQNLSLAQIQTKVSEWKAMGIDGIFFDDFGYDFQTSRARQNAAVELAHAEGLAVVANAFRVEDAFGSDADLTYNPMATAPTLNAGDYYLYESHQIRLGQFDTELNWRNKATVIEALRGQIGFEVMSITTTDMDDPAAYDPTQFFYAWHSALLFGHEATGWGEFNFSATGASNGQAPFRVRPATMAGSQYLGPVLEQSPQYMRQTDTGRIFVNTTTHESGFSRGTAVRATQLDGLRLHAPSPNPFNPRVTISFSIDQPQPVRLTIHDAAGHLIAKLADRSFPAGDHGLIWDGTNRAGNAVGNGVYHSKIEAGTQTATRKLTLVR